LNSLHDMEKNRQPNFTSEKIQVLTASVQKRSKLLMGTFSGASSSAAKRRMVHLFLFIYNVRIVLRHIKSDRKMFVAKLS